MQSALIVGLWIAQTLAQFAVLTRLTSDLAWTRFPGFALMTLFFCARSTAALILASIDGNFSAYPGIWTATQAVGLALQSAACVEAFWILARHFRKTNVFGWVLLGALAVVGAAGSLALSAKSPAWDGALRPWLVASQNVTLSLVVVGAFAVLFFRSFANEVPIRPNAIRHNVLLSVLFGGGFVATFIGQASQGQARFLANLVLLSVTAIGYATWAWIVRRDGEQLPFSPRPAASAEELARSARELDQIIRETERFSRALGREISHR
jgi:hypothetical protein